MTGKVKDEKPVARGMMLRIALLAFIFFIVGGCAGTEAPRPPVNRTGTGSPEMTEVQLLAELDRKFENPQAHYELARIYHRSTNWNKAEYHYVRAISFDPGHKAAQAGLVKMFLDSGDKAKAEQFAGGYIRDAAISITEMLRLGWEFEKLGMDDYALRTYRQAVAAAPDSDAANKQIGMYYLNKGDTASAKQYLMRSFELNPRQPDVAGELGRLGVVVQTPGIPEGPVDQKK